jgi:hypothetical protein
MQRERRQQRVTHVADERELLGAAEAEALRRRVRVERARHVGAAQQRGAAPRRR